MISSRQYYDDIQALVESINALSARIREIEPFELPTGGGAGNDLTYITVDDESANAPNSRQAAEGADIDFVDAGAGSTFTILRAGNVILRFDNGATQLVEYAKTGAGLTAALAAAAAGDIVWLPPGTYTADQTIPDDVTVIGYGWNTIIAGEVTLGDGSILKDLKVYVYESSAATLRAITGPADGETAYCLYVYAYCENTGAGEAYAASGAGDGDLHLYECVLYGETEDIEE